MSSALDVIISPQWTAIYRHPKYPMKEVVLNSAEQPPRKRKFRIPVGGVVTFTAVSITQLTEPKEGFKMAKKRSKKKKDEEELDELEGLDDLDDDEDEDEPDEEPEDSDEEEDDEDEDDDEDEEDEEEEKPKRKRKGKSKSKAKSKSKSKSKGKRGPTGPRELPKGKYSAQDIAELAEVDARAVRLFLRKKENKKKFPKNKELGRYAFTKKDATTIAKKVKADD